MNPYLSPVAIFVYNRLDHTIQTIEALKCNRLSADSQLYIFSDGFKNSDDFHAVQTVRNYLPTISGFKDIVIFESDINIGLAKSIVNGVSKILSLFDSVIVLEDDLITSPYFLDFMNDCLNFYRLDKSIGSISGYVYPNLNINVDIFRVKGAECWGWGTWKDRWSYYEEDAYVLLDSLESKGLNDCFNLNNTYNYTKLLRNSATGKNNSWAVRWHASCFLNELSSIYPKISYIKNIGFDGSGSHCGNIDYLNGEICNYKITPDTVSSDLVDGFKYFEDFFKKITIIFKIKLKLITIYKRFIKCLT